MLPFFIFMFICSPCISIASDTFENLEKLSTPNKKKSLFQTCGMTFKRESIATELELALKSKKLFASSTKSPEKGSFQLADSESRSHSQLTDDSGAATASCFASSNTTPITLLESEKETAGMLSLLFGTN
jgi:hypothetical protein